MPYNVRLTNPIHPVSLTLAQDANLNYIDLKTFIWKGTWTATPPIPYNVYDVVYSNGSSYVNKTGANGSNPPESDANNWDLMAQKGATGATGATGAQGPSGVVFASNGVENTSGNSSSATLRINPTMTTTGGTVSTTNKLAVLDNTGKLQSNILPDLAITSVTTYANTTAMYTDTTRQEGDVGVIASGTGQGSYIRNSATYSGTSSDWTQLAIPPDLVQSVRGSSGTAQTGNVVISASDIGLGNVNNTSDSSKTISGDVTGTLGSSALQTLSPSPAQATTGVYKITTDAKGRVLTTAASSASDVGALGATASINIGTTSIPVNRSPASQSLTGISIDGNAATVTNGAYVNAANTFTVAPQVVNVNSAINKGIVVRGTASQTANLQEWQDSTPTILAKVDPSGNLTAASFVKTSGTSAQFLKADGSIDDLSTSTTGGVTPSSTAANKIVSAGTTVSGTAISTTNKAVDAASLNFGLNGWPAPNGHFLPTNGRNSANNVVYFTRFYAPTALTITKIAVQVTTQSTTSSDWIDLGIYSTAGTLLASTGQYTGLNAQGTLTGTLGAGTNAKTGSSYALAAGTTYYIASMTSITTGTVTLGGVGIGGAALYGTAAGQYMFSTVTATGTTTGLNNATISFPSTQAASTNTGSTTHFVLLP